MSAGLLAFLIAASASLLLTFPVRALALRVGMVDLPGPRKVHLKPIPLLGGLAMYGGVMLAILIVFDGAARMQVLGIVLLPEQPRLPLSDSLMTAAGCTTR